MKKFCENLGHNESENPAVMYCILMELTVSDFVPLDPFEPRMIDEVLQPVFTKPPVSSTDQSLQ